MQKLLKYGLDSATKSQADFAEVRLLEIEEKHISLIDDELLCRTNTKRGVSARILHQGGWGFASTPGQDRCAIKNVIEMAFSATRRDDAAPAPGVIAQAAPQKGHWATPQHTDPFAVPNSDLGNTLRAAQAGISKDVSFQGGIDISRQRVFYVNSEGSDIQQELVVCGGGVQAYIEHQGEVLQRSWPCPRGSFAGQGYEYIEELDLVGNAPRLGEEVLKLQHAKPCPDGVMDMVLSGPQLAIALHHTCGHRARFGATGSFPQDKVGSYTVGSPLLSLDVDATLPGAAGSFGYDQEGVAAQCHSIISQGTFANFFTGREQAAALGKSSSGAMRASDWTKSPTPSISNLVLHAGAGSLNDLVADVEKGIFLETPRGFCFDSQQQGFIAQSEMGWLIERGKLVHPVRNPIFYGYPTAFWSGCDAVAGPHSYHTLGMMQDGLATGYKLVPLRIRGVKVGIYNDGHR